MRIGSVGAINRTSQGDGFFCRLFSCGTHLKGAESSMIRVVWMQLCVALILALIVSFFWTAHIATSLFLGALVVSLATWLMVRSATVGDASQQSLYKSAAIRFFTVLLALFCIALAGLNMPAAIVGMVIVYMVGFGVSAWLIVGLDKQAR